eukprot:scaffold22132_cov119-Isochrysis_galbana.AAC.3
MAPAAPSLGTASGTAARLQSALPRILRLYRLACGSATMRTSLRYSSLSSTRRAASGEAQTYSMILAA